MTNNGPMMIPHGLKFQYRTHLGPIWALCPDSAHMGPIWPRLLGTLKIPKQFKRMKATLRYSSCRCDKSRYKNPQKLIQLSQRSDPRHLIGKRTAQKDTIIDTTSNSQVNSNFPYRLSPASLTFNNYFYLFFFIYI